MSRQITYDELSVLTVMDDLSGHFNSGKDISVGRRIAMEIKQAIKDKKLGEIVT